ncbi:MAG: hypothetical protein IID35_10160 [Planctomycetes bacterium]|nr:hypothetical protein [Planctomycetota bacterium]
MPKHLLYVKKCKAEYSLGKESQYIQCVLEQAHNRAKNSRKGKDKFVVERATEALVQGQTLNPDGVLGKTILSEAGLFSYNNENTHGLWPWLEDFGGLPVVVKKPGQRYLIADRFFPALSDFDFKKLKQS